MHLALVRDRLRWGGGSLKISEVELATQHEYGLVT